jgi:hypothetical protein
MPGSLAAGDCANPAGAAMPRAEHAKNAWIKALREAEFIVRLLSEIHPEIVRMNENLA